MVPDCVASHFIGISLIMMAIFTALSFILLRFFGYIGIAGLLGGVGLVDGTDGGRVKIKTALKFILYRPVMIGLGVVALFFLISGGVIDIYIFLKIMVLALFVGVCLGIYDTFSTNEATYIERVSGARFVLRYKGQKYWNEKARKMRRGWRRILNGSGFYFNALAYVFWLFVVAVMAFNLMREPLFLNTSKTQALYERPAPQWDDNMAVAMAGLVAPADVSDSYEYGRERSEFYLNTINKMKSMLRIKSYVDVHDDALLRHSLEREEREIASFDASGEVNLFCASNMHISKDPEKCPAGSADISEAIERNKILWDRFQKIPDYKVFGVLDGNYPWGLLISLSEVEAGHILSLQRQGMRDKAVKEWLRFVVAYDRMVRGTNNSIDKLSSFILFGIHINALESMLFNDPDIARDFGDDLVASLTLQNINEIGTGDLVAGDWAKQSILVYMLFGKSPAQNERMFRCIEQNSYFSSMPAAEFFAENDRKVCPDLGPEQGYDILSWAFSQSGFFMTNIFNVSLRDNQGDVIKFSHNLISKSDLARAAIYLLKNDVSADQVPNVLGTLKSERPILWDPEKHWIYVENSHETDPEPKLKFSLNLKRKVQ